MDINVPKPEMTPYAAVNFATEISFSALMDEARKRGLKPLPVMGLMYLPSEAVTRQFQEACRAVLASVGVTFEGNG